MPRLERTAGLLLASGFSRRFGASKLMAELSGRPLAFWAIDAMVGAGLFETVLVYGGHTPELVVDYASSQGFRLVMNDRADEGMGSSIAAGIASLGEMASYAAIGLADMPFVRPDDYAALRGAFEADPAPTIAISTFEGRSGHPVMFHRTHFAALAVLSGDRGGRDLISDPANVVSRVPMQHRGVLVDIDTPEELLAAKAAAQSLE